MKRSIMFVCIAMTMLFMSCSKDKITQDNAMETLNEVLGYPCVLMFKGQLRGSILSQLDSRGLIKSYPEKRNVITLFHVTDWDGLQDYVPNGYQFELCGDVVPTLKLCGFFPTHTLEISEIIAVSEEVDGKVTIQFRMNYTPSRLNIHFSRVDDFLKNAPDYYTVELQRTETGWMVLEVDDIKKMKENQNSYRFLDYSEFQEIELVLPSVESEYLD